MADNRKEGPSAGASDATFGMDPSLDYPVREPPADQPTFGENHAFWIFDADGRYFLNHHIQSIGAYWPLRHESVSISLPDGRVLLDQNDGTNTSEGVVGGAILRAYCVEPFQRWRIEAAGTLMETTQARLADGPLQDARRVMVKWDVDMVCPVPPYRTGAGGDSALAGRFMGGLRYEQMVRADVRLRIGKDPEVRFTATGIRVHRLGPRELSGFSGHDWKGALFPDGSGFNTHRYRKPDGSEAWSEAFIIRGGNIYPGKLVEDSWLTSRQLRGEPLRARIVSELGETLIEGETLGGVFRPLNAHPDDPYGRHWGIHTQAPQAVALCQSWARYRMEGQIANGLLERSILAKDLR